MGPAVLGGDVVPVVNPCVLDPVLAEVDVPAGVDVPVDVDVTTVVVGEVVGA